MRDHRCNSLQQVENRIVSILVPYMQATLSPLHQEGNLNASQLRSDLISPSSFAVGQRDCSFQVSTCFTSAVHIFTLRPPNLSVAPLFLKRLAEMRATLQQVPATKRHSSTNSLASAKRPQSHSLTTHSTIFHGFEV